MPTNYEVYLFEGARELATLVDFRRHLSKEENLVSSLWNMNSLFRIIIFGTLQPASHLWASVDSLSSQFLDSMCLRITT